MNLEYSQPLDLLRLFFLIKRRDDLLIKTTGLLIFFTVVDILFRAGIYAVDHIQWDGKLIYHCLEGELKPLFPKLYQIFLSIEQDLLSICSSQIQHTI